MTVIRYRCSAGLTSCFIQGCAGGHEDDLVEVEALLHLAGGHQVAVVDRIEGTAHDADATSAPGPNNCSVAHAQSDLVVAVSGVLSGGRVPDAPPVLSLWRLATSR